MKRVTYTPIGIVHSPYKEPKNMPIQTISSKGVKGTVEVFPEYIEGLKDLEGFSYIILLCHFNLAKDYSLTVKPFLDDHFHGVFSTRAPSRPNPIGLSIVHLIGIEQGKLLVEDLDIVDNTPLLDIKPLVPAFDNRRTSKIGWLKGKITKLPSKTSDSRFAK
jgi:tRNA-Thr(GGU) m(6)t(6)A37 methyltransferase TsaA